MRTKFLAFAATALMLASCSNDEVLTPQDDLKDTPITIASASVAELTTRVITEEGHLIGAVDENASMSVFVTGGSNAKYNADNVEWVHNGECWSAESQTLFEGTNSKQKICALSPYRADATLEDGVTITADGVTDYLVAASTPVTSNSVSLTMTHALTKLVLRPTFGNEVTNTNIAKVEVGGMYASGTLNISDNTWSELSETNSKLEMDNEEVLVIPMSGCTSFPIVITMEDDRVFKTNINCPVISQAGAEVTVYGLAAGTQYTISLQIGQDKVTLGDITAASWGTPVDGGDLETE
jgi:lipoprotein